MALSISTDSNFPDRIGWKEIVVQASSSPGFPDGIRFQPIRSAALTQLSRRLAGEAPNVADASIRIGAAVSTPINPWSPPVR